MRCEALILCFWDREDGQTGMFTFDKMRDKCRLLTLLFRIREILQVGDPSICTKTYLLIHLFHSMMGCSWSFKLLNLENPGY